MSFPLPPRRRRKLEDFDLGDEIGTGSLSKVYAVVEPSTGKEFALKTFDRRYLKSQHKDADVTMEEHCLRRTNHPCVVKLYASFADEFSRYLVLEHCPRGELWTIAKDVGCPDCLARHYLSQVMEAVSYLRNAQIVHRDLKAENVLIGATGVAKLIDFGSAKDLANPHIKGAGTWAFNKAKDDDVGTPNFMAPEAINNKRTDYRSDIWSLGCLVFQVLSGFPPFGQDLLRIYERALKAKFRIPPGINADAVDLIKKMIRLEPNSRLGASDIRDIRKHPYFASVRCSGLRFEGAHRQPLPVLSLGDLCLHKIGKNWDHFAEAATSWAALHDKAISQHTRGILLRYAKVKKRAVMRANRPMFTDMAEHLDSEASSVDEST